MRRPLNMTLQYMCYFWTQWFLSGFSPLWHVVYVCSPIRPIHTIKYLVKCHNEFGLIYIMLFFFVDCLTVNVGGLWALCQPLWKENRKRNEEMIKNHQQHATDIYREELAQEKQWNRALLHTLKHVHTHFPLKHAHMVVQWTEISAFLWWWFYFSKSD